MKAISLWQPWASLWLSPRKVHETRHWPTKHRGQLLVHASKRFEKNHPIPLARILREQFGADWFKILPTGAIIGAVQLTDCKPSEEVRRNNLMMDDAGYSGAWDDLQCGNFENGRYGWARAREFRVFDTPIPFRGLQGIFNVPDDILPRMAA